MNCNFIEQLEDDLLKRLKPLTLEEKEVVNFPENKSGIQGAVITPRLMVIFNGEKGGDIRATDHISQENDIMMDIWLTCRTRRGKNGLYDAIEKCNLYLVGWTPPRCEKKMSFVSGQWEEIAEDNWTYIITYKTSRMMVQFDNAETGPLATQFIFNDYIPEG